jgi:aminopeptidase YwaD
MATDHLVDKADRYLRKLCLAPPGRPVGSSGNQAATAFFAETVAALGYQTESPRFDCMDWSQNGASLTVAGRSFEVFASPYSLGCEERAPLVAATSLAELEAVQAAGKILLVRGELAREQLMPKNFPFFNPEEHQRVVGLLEAKGPLAIVSATSRNPELAGGLYPFPLIEDGDLDIPSVYMTEEEGGRLAALVGQQVELVSTAVRRPSWGCNVIARRGIGPAGGPRILVCAHIDAKIDSPGALDNAAGVVVLLLLAELLSDYRGMPGLEIVALNGEDNYAAPGQKLYLSSNADRLDQIVLAANIDAAGYHQGRSAYSLYGCPDEIDTAARQAFAAHRGLVEGDAWYQSDHAIFVQNQVPALAITSDRFTELTTHVTHTEKDRPELVDGARLVEVAEALAGLVRLLALDTVPAPGQEDG